MTVLTIARTTFGDAIRRKVLMAFFGVAVAMMPISMSFSFITFGAEMTTIRSFGLGLIGIAGLLIAVIMGIQIVPTEIERRTIYTILSKPVNRYEFLLGKFLGAVMTLVLSVLLMGTVFILAVGVKMALTNTGGAAGGAQVAKIFSAVPVVFISLMPAIILIAFELIMVVAMAMFFSTYLGAWVNFFATAGLYCIGSLSSVTGSIIQDSTKPPMSKMFAGIVHYAVPQFGNFHVLNPIIEPHFQVRNFNLYITQTVVYSVIVCVVLMILAILVFEKKEV